MTTFRWALLLVDLSGISVSVCLIAYCIRRRAWVMIPGWLLLGALWVGHAYLNLRRWLP